MLTLKKETQARINKLIEDNEQESHACWEFDPIKKQWHLVLAFEPKPVRKKRYKKKKIKNTVQSERVKMIAQLHQNGVDFRKIWEIMT